MVSILLTILKIIGMTLLIILGLILFISLLILFIPVRYRGNGSYHDNRYRVKLRATWLFHIVSVKGEYQKEQAWHIVLRIFGIAIYDNLKKTAKKKKNKKTKSTKTKTGSTSEIQAASSEDGILENDVTDEPLQDKSVSKDADGWSEPEVTVNDDFQDKLTDNSAKKMHILQKIKILFIKFVKFFQNIKFTINKVCDTIIRIKNNIKYYIKVLQLDSTKIAIAKGKEQIEYVLKKISPRKYRIRLHLGFEDPEVMGGVLAVWGMFYPMHLGNINIEPEFDRSVMEGDFSLQGGVSVFVFVKAARVLFFDKDIKRLMKQLKREDL